MIFLKTRKTKNVRIEDITPQKTFLHITTTKINFYYKGTIMATEDVYYMK